MWCEIVHGENTPAVYDFFIEDSCIMEVSRDEEEMTEQMNGEGKLVSRPV